MMLITHHLHLHTRNFIFTEKLLKTKRLMTLLAVDDLPIQDKRTFALLRWYRSEMLSITMRALAQNLFQDTIHRQMTLSTEHALSFERFSRKFFSIHDTNRLNALFLRLSTNVELQLVTPPLCAGTTVRFARRQFNRRLPPWTTNQNRLGGIIHNILMVADTKVHKAKKHFHILLSVSDIKFLSVWLLFPSRCGCLPGHD